MKAAVIVMELLVIALGLLYLAGVWTVEYLRHRREQ